MGELALMKRMLLAGLVALAGAATATADPYRISEFSKQPNISGLSMSPEGDFIVGMVAEPGSNNERQAVAVWELDREIDTTKPLIPSSITPSDGRMQLFGAQALTAGVVRVTAGQTWSGSNPCTEGGSTAGSVDTWTYKAFWTTRDLKKFDDGIAGLGNERIRDPQLENCMRLNGRLQVYTSLPLEEDYVILERFDPNSDKTEYFKTNLRTGERQGFVPRYGRGEIALNDPRNGDVLVRQDVEPRGGEFFIETYIFNEATNSFEKEEPLTYNAADRYEVRVLGRDEQSGQFYVLTDKFSDKAAIYFYDVNTDQFSSEPVFAHPDFAATGIVLGSKPHNFNRPLGFLYGDIVEKTYWIDPEVAGIQDGLNAAFPGQIVEFGGSNDDYSRILFSTYKPNQPRTYFVLVDKSKVAVIGAQMPWLNDGTLGEGKLVYYTARDGMEVPAILTMPGGWTPADGPVPAIVYPHGGPWVRDFPAGYDFNVQAMAGNGIAVLQPQYRGSTGWGRKLWLAGDMEWGQKMQDDKDDGARWLVEQGFARADQIAIMGFSYGGYAAFAATIRDNSPFQCAIGGAGVANVEFFNKRVSQNKITRQIQGWTIAGLDPIRNGEKAHLPILIYHGDRDVRVPPKEGRTFYDAVRSYTDATYVEIKDMPHGYQRPEFRREKLDVTFDFLTSKCNFQL